MSKPKAVILDGYAQNPGDLNWDYINSVTELTIYDRTPPELTAERAAGASIIVLNKVLLTRDIIEKLPDLRFVALLSTGFNAVDGACLRERGVSVSNIPSYSTEAVAQMVIAYILSFSNSVAQYTESIKAGDWTRGEDFCYLKYPLFELGSRTLGIIGFGQIGAAVVRRAHALGMRIVAYTPSGSKPGFDYVSFMSLDEVLHCSDFVTVHTPLTSDTTGLVNASFISKMKDGAYLINTSRGAVVNEHDAADALLNGKLSGMAADVLSTEPPAASNPLLSAPNCLLTPHVAWGAYETRERLLSILNDNISAYLSGCPKNVVN